MKQKGFTLIELLAVIVVLAVIALIAVPIVLNVIEKSKEGAAVDSAYGYIHAIENGVTIREIKDKEIVSNGEYTNLREFESDNNITLKGTKPSSGTFTLEKRRVVSAELIINGYRVICDKKTCRTSGKTEKVTVTYNPNGGTLSKNSDEIYKGDTLTLPTPTAPTNYSFAGWYTQSDGKGELISNDSVIMSDLTLYAYYVKTVREYVFDPDGDGLGQEQAFTALASGNYKIELWGASGSDFRNYKGGLGSYTSGIINLNKNTELYLYVGGQGSTAARAIFNNGTVGCYATGGNTNGNSCLFGASGGGSTDVRLVNGAWNNATSLNSRIMVAASGAGAEKRGDGYGEGNGGAGGGLVGYTGNRVNYSNYGQTNWEVPTQTSYATVTYNGNIFKSSFGNGDTLNGSSVGSVHATPGNGYYAGAEWAHGSGSGGSSYISGHTGCVAIKENSTSNPREVKIDGCVTGTTDMECSKHYSNLVFTNTKMIDGQGYAWTNTKGGYEQMPNPSGGTYAQGVGHSGNGYAKITYLGE